MSIKKRLPYLFSDQSEGALLFKSIVLVGFFFGPLLGGLAISTFGYTAFFLFAAALTLLAALLMIKILK